jgi:hypothetical protein
MTLVVGLYDTLQRAQGAVEDLIELRVPARGRERPALRRRREPARHERRRRLGHRLGVRAPAQRLIVAGPLAAWFRAQRGDGHGRVPEVLCAAGLSRFAATYFNEAICDGGVLVAVQCDEGLVRDARDILDTHAPDGFDDYAVPFGERHAPAAAPVVHVNGKGHRS